VIDQLVTATAIVNSTGDLLDSLVNFVPKIIAACSVIAALIPAPESEGTAKKIYCWINRLAVNVKHAKNAEDV
jgi:hypothetical protein